ncbi:MAG: aminopeptidase P N-terminal domain-containing protein [Candidatus Poribacteria bacterium]|nr:aminopeptidase P N-terminal domain-containing protein [Candidatus Poribacteria bacterium]
MPDNPTLTPEFFASRRDRFFDRIGEDAVAIIEAAPSTETFVRPWRRNPHFDFRQGSHFHYLTGFPEPNAVAVFFTGNGKREFILFVPPKDPVRETWDGRRAGVEGAKERYGADVAYSVDQLGAELSKYIRNAGHVYYTSNIQTATGRAIYDTYQSATAGGRALGHGAYETIDPHFILSELRVVKTSDEIAMMRRAADITTAAYDAVLDTLQPGMMEYEVEALLNYYFRRTGGDGPAYTTIVGGGDNATILHYVENDTTLNDGELLLIDAGAAYQHYSCDVTRTFPINGKFSPAQRRVYDLVLHAEKTVIDAVKPDSSLKILHELAVRVVTEGLKELGLLEDKALDDLIKDEAYREFFMHGSGHFLGLDTHDVGPSQARGNPYPLQPGMVFTIEPGVYIPIGTEGVAKEYHGIGVRVEDDVLVTADGCDVLTKGVPKEVKDLESRIGKKGSKSKGRGQRSR